MLEAEWEFYENNRDELIDRYTGKFIVISGNRVVAVYDGENKAYREMIKASSSILS